SAKRVWRHELPRWLHASHRPLRTEAGIRAQQLSDAASKKISELESQLFDARAKETALQASLDKAWADAADARRAAAESATAAQSEALEEAVRSLSRAVPRH